MKPSIIIRISESELRDVDRFVKAGYGKSRADLVRKSLINYIPQLRELKKEEEE